MFGFKSKDLEESRKEKLEAMRGVREAHTDTKAATRRANTFFDKVAQRTEHAMIETAEFMRGH